MSIFNIFSDYPLPKPINHSVIIGPIKEIFQSDGALALDAFNRLVEALNKL